jgi:hypothetical protein
MATKRQSAPLVIRILPNRRRLRLGTLGGLALSAASLVLRFGGFAATPASTAIALPLGIAGVCLAAVCAARMLLQLPIIEVTELGVAAWLQGPYRHPFFMPWSRIRSISGRSRSNMASGAASRAAERLVAAIELDADSPAHRTGGNALTWPAAAIDGAAAHWAERMLAMRPSP